MKRGQTRPFNPAVDWNWDNHKDYWMNGICTSMFLELSDLLNHSPGFLPGISLERSGSHFAMISHDMMTREWRKYITGSHNISSSPVKQGPSNHNYLRCGSAFKLLSRPTLFRVYQWYNHWIDVTFISVGHYIVLISADILTGGDAETRVSTVLHVSN